MMGDQTLGGQGNQASNGVEDGGQSGGFDQQRERDHGVEQQRQSQTGQQSDVERSGDANRGGGREGSQANQADQGGNDRR